MTLIDVSGSAPNYASPSTTISGVSWATEYPGRATAIATALTAMRAEVGECLTIADDMHEQIT